MGSARVAAKGGGRAGLSMAESGEWAIYLKSLAVAFLAVAVAVSFQSTFVLRRFEPKMLLVPFAMACIIGLLVGRIMVLGRRLRRRGAKFRAVADLAQEFTYFRNIDGHYDYVSPAVGELTGYSPADFYAVPDLMNRLIHPEDRGLWERHTQHMDHDGQAESIDIRLLARDGREVWVTHICAPVFDEAGHLVGQRATNIDITQRRSYEDHIERMAYFDSLTDLPNRNLLARFLREQIEATDERHYFAVLFLDLHRFNHINDSFGHAFGDLLLAQVGRRLKECCQHHGLVARFGGDEFVVVASDLDNSGDAVEYAQHLLDTVEEPFHVEQEEIYISGSVGISLYPFDGQDAETLIRNADAAMYRSKRERSDFIRLYTPSLVEDAADFVDIESRMRRGLGRREFILHYQPKVAIDSGRIVSLEALVRWQSPGRGLIPPDDFIPIAEETGLIRPLGEQILRDACRQVSQWQVQGIRIPVAVNISGRQFSDSNFCETVGRILKETDCDPALLELEVTEQVFLHDMTATVAKLTRLRHMGIRIALDDFGTGYSSLNYLKELPLDAVKIDMSFIRHITEDPRDLAILRAIVLLCSDLHMETIAEGIESLEQRTLLAGLGCGIGQGFFFHRPLPPEEIGHLLADPARVAGGVPAGETRYALAGDGSWPASPA